MSYSSSPHPCIEELLCSWLKAQVSRTLQHLFWAAHTAGCGGETLSQLASLCPGSLQARFAAASKSHIQASLFPCKAQQQDQLTWSCWEPSQEPACSSQPGEPNTQPHRNRQNQAPPLHQICSRAVPPSPLCGGCGAVITGAERKVPQNTPSPSFGENLLSSLHS